MHSPTSVPQLRTAPVTQSHPSSTRVSQSSSQHAVAKLGGGIDLSAARAPGTTAAADLSSRATRADVGSTAPGRAADAQASFVDGSVAVLVKHTVAGFGARPHFARAASPGSGAARLRAGDADPNVRSTRADQPVVDGSVAVIVDVVASLGDAFDPADTFAEHAGGARFRAGDAASDIGAARPRHHLIDRAIAIVVEVVAELDARGLATVAATPRARIAHFGAHSAHADIGAARAAQRLVGHPVAVVVEVVAELDSRASGAFAIGAHAHDASLHAGDAFAGVGAAREVRVAVRAFAPVVRRAIAVFVGSGGVAHLFARDNVAFARAPRSELELPHAEHRPVDAISGGAVARVAPKTRHRLARCTRTPFVDDPVAIGVQAIAATLVALAYASARSAVFRRHAAVGGVRPVRVGSSRIEVRRRVAAVGVDGVDRSATAGDAASQSEREPQAKRDAFHAATLADAAPRAGRRRARDDDDK